MSIIKNSKLNIKPSIVTVVTIDKKRYSTFERVVVSRSIDYVCGEFSITMSRPANGATPFKTGDVLDIIIDGEAVMRGKIYTISLEGDFQNDYIILSGRDITGDLIDSTVPDSAKVFVGGTKIENIARSIIISKGMQKDISVFSPSGADVEPFGDDEIVTCATGDTVIEFLQKYCRKRQLFINTLPTGDLVFFRGQGYETGNNVINNLKNNNNNVMDYKSKFGIADRYFKYICKTQAVEWANEDSNVDSSAEAYDVDVSNYRELEFILEEGSSGSNECWKRAIEEANVRRARSFEYSPTVAGFKDKQMWAINQFVNVSDDRAGVTGKFLIKGVEYKIDNSKGATTKLTIVDVDAYTLEASLRLRDRDKSKKQWYNEKDAKDELQTLLRETLSD